MTHLEENIRIPEIENCFTTLNKKEKYIPQDLYSLVIHPKMLLRAYRRVVKAQPTRAMESTFSMARIIDLHQSLKASTYRPQPFVNVWIPKIQPLEMKKSFVVSTLEDCIVQESIRRILAKIYAPYGFKRQNRRSIQDAIKKFNGSSWKSRYVLQGNLEGVCIHNKQLRSVLERTIQDQQLLHLVDKFLKANGALGSLLFNIYMQPFDCFINTEVRNLNTMVYLRYGEDWMLINCGTRKCTQRLQNKIQTFLKTQFELQCFPEKIFITNIQKNWTYFLGFAIQVQNTVQTKMIIKIDRQRLAFQLKRKGFLNAKNKSLHKLSWAVLPDFQIVHRYRHIIRNIFDYYTHLVNREHELNWTYYILRTSCAKTLAAKYKLRTMKKVFKKYGPNLKVKNTEKNLYITFPTLKQLKIKKFEY